MDSLTAKNIAFENAPNLPPPDLAQELSRFLASTYMLYQKTLFYCWNVKEPHKSPLPKLFEELSIDLQKAGNDLASHIRLRGQSPSCGAQMFLSLSSVQEDSISPENDRQMLENLMAAHEICLVEAEHVLALAEAIDDQAVMESMQQRIKQHEQILETLRAFLS
jgi:starvation-inducible DNA-binding protein